MPSTRVSLYMPPQLDKPATGSVTLPTSPRCLNRCLRHLAYHVHDLSQMPTKRSSALPGRADDLQSDDDTGLGRRALGAIWSRLLEFSGAALLYLACELLVWGLSQVFRPTEIRFPASVIAMIVIFAVMCSLQVVWYGAEGVYDRWIKSKVVPSLPSPYRG